MIWQESKRNEVLMKQHETETRCTEMEWKWTENKRGNKMRTKNCIKGRKEVLKWERNDKKEWNSLSSAEGEKYLNMKWKFCQNFIRIKWEQNVNEIKWKWNKSEQQLIPAQSLKLHFNYSELLLHDTTATLP